VALGTPWQNATQIYIGHLSYFHVVGSAQHYYFVAIPAPFSAQRLWYHLQGPGWPPHVVAAMPAVAGAPVNSAHPANIAPGVGHISTPPLVWVNPGTQLPYIGFWAMITAGNYPATAAMQNGDALKVRVNRVVAAANAF
jgi:hypothetical protein